MRLLQVAALVLAGGGAAGGLYWGFLNTPESTGWALMLSALLLVLALLVVGVTVNGAILWWTEGTSRAAMRRAVRQAPAALPAALVVIAVWWLTTRGETWVTLRSGPINAWFIARFGWDDVSWLFAAVRYAAVWARWVLAAILATWLMASLLHGAKYRPSIARVALASVWFALLVAAPWRYLVPWRPSGLPATSIELVFIAVKLGLAALIIAAGAALVIREAAPHRSPS